MRSTISGGARLGLFPFTFAGAEVEGGLTPSRGDPGDAPMTVVQLRAHGVAQLPLARLVPFAVVGGGMWGVYGAATGHDVDPTFHFGGGLKFALTQHVSFRLDVRDTLIQKNRLLPSVRNGEMVHNGEVLGGVSFTLGRTPWEPSPPPIGDSDGDGIRDDADRCPYERGPAPLGCPPVDDDRDGVADADDRCIGEAEDGKAPDPHDGCPTVDPDGDGLWGTADQCPNETGPLPTGCPLPPDADGDGIPDAADKCPGEPETKNGYEDEDGCPDEKPVVPAEAAKFSGAVRGIEFDTGKSSLRPASFAVLNEIVTVLERHPLVRVRVVGHTDASGDAAANVALSKARADAVRAYIVSHDILAARVETEGRGAAEPVADNRTRDGRARNRRIELTFLPE
jgi:OOP family OmpA-OmpF porin